MPIPQHARRNASTRNRVRRAAVRIDVRIDAPSAPPESPGTIRKTVSMALRRALRAAVAPRHSIAMDVWITTDGIIRRLNAAHRGIDRATDCLSFPQLTPAEARRLWAIDPPSCLVSAKAARRRTRTPSPEFPEPVGAPVPLGDIVMSLPAIRRQAARRRASLDVELRFVSVHSLLHLLGCDHDTPARRRAMWKLNQALASHVR